MALKSSRANALWPAFIVGGVGLLWLAQESKWLATNLPLGPLSVLIVALALVYYFYPSN